MKSLIVSRIQESIAVKNSLLQDDALITGIEEIASTVEQALAGGRKILFAGNGGSYADSIHLAAEFVSRFRFDRAPLAAISLGANNSILTAVGNDYTFHDVFSRELQALGRPGDVFIGLSTSGNSPNIVSAVKDALDMGLTVFCLTGSSGGRLLELCPCLRIPSDITARIQEAHITIGHIICEIVEDRIFNGGSRGGAEAK